MDQIKTGRLIRALRQGQNLTQAELGEKLGVGGKAVSKWECGREPRTSPSCPGSQSFWAWTPRPSSGASWGRMTAAPAISAGPASTSARTAETSSSPWRGRRSAAAAGSSRP